MSMTSQNELHFKGKSKSKWISQRISKHYKNHHTKYPKCWWDIRHNTKCIKNERMLYLRNSWVDRDVYTNCEPVTNPSIVDAYGIKDIPYITWQCDQCTFINGPQASFCSMCNKPFDFNYQNNAQYLSQYDQIPITKSIKFAKRSTTRKVPNNRPVKHATQLGDDETSKMMAAMFFGQDTSYSIYAEDYRLRKNKQAKQTDNKKRMPNLESHDIQISITATKYNHYKYINPQLWYNKTWFWENVPMELININVLQCSFKIIYMDAKHTKYMKTFDFTPSVNIILPIHITNYSFIYKNESIPEILHNKKLLRFIKHCLLKLRFDHRDNIKFDSKHMSVMEYDLRSVLFEYIPASDIVNNVLCPFIGYESPLHIKTVIRNVKIDKDRFAAQRNHRTCEISYYPSSIAKIKRLSDRLPIQNNDKNGLLEDLSESSSCAVPPAFLFSENTDSDESHEREITDNEVNAISDVVAIETASFKTPYRYRMRYNLTDDDPERDRKWWKQVKYERDHCIRNYKVNDRVRVQKRYCNSVGTVVAVGNTWIHVKYDGNTNGAYYIDQYEYERVKLIRRTTKKSKKQCSLQRKQKAYSKTNNMCYCKPNFV
eukprot:158174_1